MCRKVGVINAIEPRIVGLFILLFQDLSVGSDECLPVDGHKFHSARFMRDLNDQSMFQYLVISPWSSRY
ncbi:hypothetical protein [Pareuzebyella sediminis]|uniref:hypothetical protein n=1 Tax=Pareuzebyella sediminis TaxID=2607998 RepID=UPI0011EF43C5|nr:hypothetical protein [Pareuzebyella sediminis]